MPLPSTNILVTAMSYRVKEVREERASNEWDTKLIEPNRRVDGMREGKQCVKEWKSEGEEILNGQQFQMANIGE